MSYRISTPTTSRFEWGVNSLADRESGFGHTDARERGRILAEINGEIDLRTLFRVEAHEVLGLAPGSLDDGSRTTERLLEVLEALKAFPNAAWTAAKAPIAEAVNFVAPRIDGAIRGGGSGGSAWVARVTGTHPQFHLARQFLDKDQEHVSRSRRSGWFTWVLDRPGYYEIRDVQYEAGVASIGRLDRGFLKVDQAGAVTRVSKDTVIAAMRALEAAAV